MISGVLIQLGSLLLQVRRSYYYRTYPVLLQLGSLLQQVRRSYYYRTYPNVVVAAADTAVAVAHLAVAVAVAVAVALRCDILYVVKPFDLVPLSFPTHSNLFW